MQFRHGLTFVLQLVFGFHLAVLLDTVTQDAIYSSYGFVQPPRKLQGRTMTRSSWYVIWVCFSFSLPLFSKLFFQSTGSYDGLLYGLGVLMAVLGWMVLVLRNESRLNRIRADVRAISNRKFQLGEPDKRRDTLGEISRQLHEIGSELDEDVLLRLAVRKHVTDQDRVDDLSGLKNRQAALDWHKLNKNTRTPEPVLVFYFQLLRYQQLQVTYGNPFAKKLLQNVGSRMRLELDPELECFRLQGNEFLVIARGIKSDRQILLERQLQDLFTNSFETVAGEILVGINLQSAQSRSDAAVMPLIEKLENRCKAAQTKSILRRSPAIAAFKLISSAIKEDRIDAAFQPVVCMGDGDVPEMKGAEGFVRIRDAKGDPIPPSNYLPDLQDSEGGVVLDKWMISYACKNLAMWKQNYRLPHSFVLSVNVTRVAIRSEELLKHLRQSLTHHGLSPASLGLELTGAMSESDIQSITELGKLGVGFILDDVGLKDSNLALLDRINPKFAKIDRRRLCVSETEAVEAAVGRDIEGRFSQLCTHLDIDVIAKSVDSPKQLAELASKQIRLFQGYYFDEPVSSEELMLRWHTRLAGCDEADTHKIGIAS